jgi:HNH endonuclease
MAMPLYVKNHDEYAVVDDCDYLACEQFSWHVKRSRDQSYPCASVKVNGFVKTLRLHRFIAQRAGVLTTENMAFEVHHKNGDRFDCRRRNLVVLSPIEHGRVTRGCEVPF